MGFTMKNYPLNELKEKIREEINMVDLISEYVHLEKRGKNFVALCPFHQENTPSFIVSPERQTFKCFGCNVGGNAISFLMKYENLSFSDTLKSLARRLGVDTESPAFDAQKTRSNLLILRQLNKFAAGYFYDQLLNHNNIAAKSALQYLKKRGLKLETIETFKIGYAPSGWNSFLKSALKAGFSEELMVEGGLIVAKTSDGSQEMTTNKELKNSEYRDRFYERIMFPICDEWAEIVGFGGRVFDSEPESNRPKYINSPDTPLYHKSQVLYNLNLAKAPIQKLERAAILTEGYLDAIIPYQEGVSNVVASLGTALSDAHAKLLKRYSNEVIVVYDPDNPGLRAAVRGFNILVKYGIRVKVVFLPPGDDLDSFIRKKSAAEFNKLIKAKLDLIDYQIRLASKEYDTSLISGKVQLVNEILPTLAQIKNRIELAEYVKKLAVDLKLEEMDIWQELKKLEIFPSKPPPLSPKKPLPLISRTSAKRDPILTIEYKLLECIVYSPELIPFVKEKLSSADFSSAEHSKIAELILNANIQNQWDTELQNLLDTLSEDEPAQSILSGILLSEPISSDLEIVKGCIKRIREFQRRKTEEKLVELKRQQFSGDPIALAKALKDLNENSQN